MNLSYKILEIGFLSVTFIDLLDIAIATFIFYKLYYLMKGTIASQIFIGLISIFGLSFISGVLELKLLSWLLKIVSDIWVIAMIILFQPELRRILLIMGRTGNLKAMNRYDVNWIINEITSVMEECSIRNYGLLIVIIRNNDLSLSVDTGVPIGAKLSKEMLLSIFNPKSPLHDGAVVISGEQIRSARVVLPFSPLTRATDTMLGTRHRAALGVAEQTDALALVVSEETGSLSYAYNGKLFLNEGLEAIRYAIAEIIGEKNKIKK